MFLWYQSGCWFNLKTGNTRNIEFWVQNVGFWNRFLTWDLSSWQRNSSTLCLVVLKLCWVLFYSYMKNLIFDFFFVFSYQFETNWLLNALSKNKKEKPAKTITFIESRKIIFKTIRMSKTIGISVIWRMYSGRNL